MFSFQSTTIFLACNRIQKAITSVKAVRSKALNVSGGAVVMDAFYLKAAYSDFWISEISLTAEGTDTKVEEGTGSTLTATDIEVNIGATVTNDATISVLDIGYAGVIGKVGVIINLDLFNWT